MEGQAKEKPKVGEGNYRGKGINVSSITRNSDPKHSKSGGRKPSRSQNGVSTAVRGGEMRQKRDLMHSLEGLWVGVGRGALCYPPL